MFKVALVGHSQVPSTFEAPEGAEVRIFRRRGGLIQHFNQSPLVDVYAYNPDLIILFLGSNDVLHYANNWLLLVQGLRDILYNLTSVCPRVWTVTIERRKFTSNHLSLLYESCRKKINRKLRKYIRNMNVRMVNITSTWFLDNLSTDGVHFNAQAKQEIISKFNGVIHRCMV